MFITAALARKQVSLECPLTAAFWFPGRHEAKPKHVCDSSCVHGDGPGPDEKGDQGTEGVPGDG